MPVDPRFFEPRQTFTIEQVANLTGAEIRGETTAIELTNVAAALEGRSGDLVFFDGRPEQVATVSAEATACFVKEEACEHLPDTVTALIVSQPRHSHIEISNLMFAVRAWNEQGAAPHIHEDASIAPSAVIGANAAIGAGTEIAPNAVIGPGVQIGTNCRIGPNTSVRCSLIGNHVTIHAGVVIGEAGFGVIGTDDGALDIPQFGRVIVQDYVSIGASSTVDRGAFGDTIIGERTKIDNLCHIGHNVVLGRNVLLAGFAGISGSSVLEDGVIAGGRVGVADHVTVGQGAQLAASAGIFRDIPAGETWGGVPAKPLRQWMREISWLQKQAGTRKKPK